MNISKVDRFSRRQILGATLAGGVSFATGCRQSVPEGQPPAPQAEREKVPLRVVYAGEISDLQVIERGWGSISDHPLEIKSLPLTRVELGAVDSDLTSECVRCDVAIVPLSLLPALRRADVIVPLSGGLVDNANRDMGPLYPAVRNGAALFAGEMICMPLGAMQPCLVASDPVSPLGSWEDYDELVQSWGGLAAEPTGLGWAAGSFLARCVEQEQWLFDGGNLQPLLTNASYVDALKLMVQTCGRYQAKDLNPAEIWESVANGSLKGGIAFPTGSLISDANLTVQQLPGKHQPEKILLDSFSPVGVLSAMCRQTAIARQFMLWISGGDGSESVRSQIAGMGSVRRLNGLIRESDSTTLESTYQRFLFERLNQPVTLPTLQILESQKYINVLDQQVRLAIQGDVQPAESLVEASRQWNAITDQVGREEQMKVWKRLNGMIA